MPEIANPRLASLGVPVEATRPSSRRCRMNRGDLIADGLEPRPGLRRALSRSLNSLCLSFIHQGGTVEDLLHALQAPPPKDSRWGGWWSQYLRDGSDRPLTTAAAYTQIRRAWTRAEKWAAAHPPLTRDELLTQIEAQTEETNRYVFTADLPENVRRVVRFVCVEERRRGMTKVAVPRDATAKALGLSRWHLTKALDQAEAAGLLRKTDQGRRSKDPADRRATLYTATSPRTLLPLSQEAKRAGQAAKRSNYSEEIDLSEVVPPLPPMPLPDLDTRKGSIATPTDLWPVPVHGSIATLPAPEPSEGTTEGDPMSTITLTLTPDREAVILRALAEYEAQQEAQPTPLRVVKAGGDQ